LFPEDSPLYEDGLQDSQELMQLLSGLEKEGIDSQSMLRSSARIKSKRSLSSLNGSFVDEDEASLDSGDGLNKPSKKKKGKTSISTSSSNKPITDQQRIERR